MVFNITLQQMAIMFLFMTIGYFIMRKKVLPDNAASVISKLLVQVFTPGLVFKTFSNQFTLQVLQEKAYYMLPGALIILGGLGVAMVLSRLLTKDPMTRSIYDYSMTVPNLGYMGYPLVGGILGEQMLMDYMIMGIPQQIFIYTVGLYMLNPKKELSFKKIINPPIIAMLLGMIVGLTGVKMPELITTACTSAGNCMSPCAMMLAGFVLAKQPINKMLIQWRSYLLSVIKLIVYPLVGLILMRLLNAPRDIAILGIIQLALPLGLNSVVFPEAFGGDSTPGAQLCFVGYIMAVFTIPAVFSVLSTFYGI